MRTLSIEMELSHPMALPHYYVTDVPDEFDLASQFFDDSDDRYVQRGDDVVTFWFTNGTAVFSMAGPDELRNYRCTLESWEPK